MNDIEISQLDSITGGGCYSFNVKFSIIVAQVEVGVHFGDCPL